MTLLFAAWSLMLLSFGISAGLLISALIHAYPYDGDIDAEEVTP